VIRGREGGPVYNSISLLLTFVPEQKLKGLNSRPFMSSNARSMQSLVCVCVCVFGLAVEGTCLDQVCGITQKPCM
jgi:hypothetical protein